MRGVIFLFRRLAQAFASGWIEGVRWIRQMLAALRELRQIRAGGTERQRRMTDERCVAVRHPALQRPDPLIYSQTFLMGLGLAVTWDNPDIQLSLNGVPVSSSGLQADTEYDLTARIWNGSTEAPVVGLPVRFTQHGFGIATGAQEFAQTTVDLGVKGGPNQPAFATVKWRTPAGGGHYCLQVHLDWYDDSNPNNNLGQENTDVAAASSPAQTTFRLRNDDRERRRRYRFETDAYIVPEPPSCREVDRESERDRRGRRMLAGQPLTRAAVAPAVLDRHDPARHRVPQGWDVELQPSQPVLGPGEEIDVQLVVTPPGGWTGRQAINVNAFDDVAAVGGVTLFVEAS
jgi:hypothetical protein